MYSLIGCVLIAILVVGWMRWRLWKLERRIDDLARTKSILEGRIDDLSRIKPAPRAGPPVMGWPLRVYPPPTVPPARQRPLVRPETGPIPQAEPEPAAAATDWETVVGGNWLNKIGMFVLVIGMALALGYSFTYMGPWGRVAISLAASAGMILGGIVLEYRERYRTFARGLIGGGWAALYFTVYAMYALDAARVIHDPLTAALMLIAVSAGIILHSLRYRSQTVSGLAYFIAFVTLAITEVNALSVVALAPLAASLLYVARRFSWRRFALFGAASTYITCALRGDTGAVLWQAQAIFAIYWLLFEAFDILEGDAWLLPLNAAGFLGLSMVKWETAAPGRLWQFLTAAAIAYLASTALRIRAGRWQGALTVAAGLAAGASLLKLDREWSAIALLAEAEILYLSGLRLGVPYLRYLAAGVFALNVLHVQLWDRTNAWASITALTAAVFYANRLLQSRDVIYGYAGAALAALLAWERAPNHDPALAWMVLAAGAFLAGWARDMRDFLYQACGLAALGVFGMVFRPDEPVLSMAIAVAMLYAGALSTEAARPVHVVASGLLALLLYRQVSGSLLTVAWGVAGVVLLAAGFPLRDRILRLCGIGLLVVCIFKLFVYDLSYLETLPRIFSFIGLGLLLVGVSWIYTRFRERISRYL